jgi:hypothetical protein
MTSEIIENGFKNLTSDWTVEMRQGDELLAVVPAQSTFKFNKDGNRLQILKSYEGMCIRTGTTDNFILRNEKLKDMWLKGAVGTRHNNPDAEMHFDDVNLMKGNSIWLNTFTFWF